MDKNQILQETMNQLIERAIGKNLLTDVPLGFRQMQALDTLNRYCVEQTLGDEEVMRDPRKLAYKSNQELQLALSALCLSQSLIRSKRSYKETREFFSSNIVVTMNESGLKSVSFGKIAPDLVQEAIYDSIVEDWKIYRDREGMNIKSLIDVKTNFTGLSGFLRGGNKVQEFARFNRKYFEKEKKKEERARENLENSMRAAIAQNVMSKMTDKLLAEGKSPQEIMDSLMNSLEYKPQKQKTRPSPQLIDKKVEENIAFLLEDRSNEREK
ncbi:MAG: hypothetical protein IJ660_02260 [Alphaproteobacteria bacterium]|nr:hypothetical protein [Alphaproteobacteria bacterium]